MELEFTKTDISHYDLVYDTVCSREETLEMIVPDACPDIVQVADTYGFCVLSRREMTDSGAMLAGRVKVTILYLPEGSSGLRRLEAELPFQHMTECASVDSGCRLLAGADVVTAETRMINPRKILLRVDLHERIQVYRPETMSLCSGLEAEESLGLQQRVEHYQASCTLSCAEKEFPFEENLTLPGGRSTAAVLRLQPNVYCSESRLIGSKLVVKGGVLLHLLCQGEEGELYTADFDLPFSQMLESGGAGEEAMFQLFLQVLDWQLGELSPDGRSISVSLELAAQAVFYETLSAAMVTDAYSTYFPVTMERKSWSFQRLTDSSVQRQVIREFAALETSGVRTVCDSHLELGAVQPRLESDSFVLSVPVAATVLYLDEAGQYRSLRHTFTVSLQQPAPQQGKISCHCVPGRLEVLPAAAGVELRGTVEFHTQTRQLFSVEGLARLELDTDHPLSHEGQPSVVLRRPEPGESLWELAKRYATTGQEICAANGITEEQALGDQMLLIPRKR
ncbi:MAG TPA: DUF3794 domain-containing protein [Candidatus Onthomonas avicola]|nr:DUF3794 domain-containing protein [Candidatus Onthomonas avicola]